MRVIFLDLQNKKILVIFILGKIFILLNFTLTILNLFYTQEKYLFINCKYNLKFRLNKQKIVLLKTN